MAPCPLAVQLYTFRDQLPTDPAAVISRIAEMGIVGVEPLCPTGMPTEIHDLLSSWTVDTRELKRMLDDHGLVVCSAHTAFPDEQIANAVFDEQEFLGNDTLVMTSLDVLPGATSHDLGSLDTLKRAAERLNEASARAATRGMRIGYHNHGWEWDARIDGQPAYNVFWDHLDPSVVAELDIYWAQLAGIDPAEVFAMLGEHAELVHVKDGPLVADEPMEPVGSGNVDITAALTAGEHLRWHIIELDAARIDMFDAVEKSAHWLVGQGLSTLR